MDATPEDPPAPVTVFVHVHYPEVWEGMCRLLAARMTVPFRLVLTTSHDPRTLAVPHTTALLGCEVLQVENRGRDILPFLRALAAAPAAGIGLKLHTKRSPQRQDGAMWLAAVLDSLVPRRWPLPWGPRGVADVVQRLRADRRIGLVAPARFALGVRPWVLENAPGMIRVMNAAGAGPGLAAADLDGAYFAAGSMFWFRHDALAGLLAPAVLNLFEPEQGQLDFTAAHAIERLFPVEARRRGFLSMAVPALLASHPAMPLPALQRLAAQHADISTDYFPAPNIPARPPRRRAGLRLLR